MWRTLKRILKWLGIVVAIAAVITLAEITLGQPMGLFSGSRPTDLGFTNGKFTAAPSWKPNNVSSTSDPKDDKHYVAPIAYKGDATAAWKSLKGMLKDENRATVVTDKSNYIHAEFKTAMMGYVDDVEFALDEKAGVIHIRSSSRLGIRDFGVNRERVERIRAAMAK